MTTWFAPGRIEVLGKHTDYAGGSSLLAAIDRGVTVQASDCDRWVATSGAVPGEVPLDDLATLPPGHWGGYLRTVVARLQANFGPMPPTRLAVSSTLPLASGMSSSSALVTATTLALAHHHGLDGTGVWREQLRTPLDLACYLATVENGSSFGPLAGSRGVGTQGGSEDHVAIVCGRPGELAHADFRTLVPTLPESLPMGGELAFVVLVSGVLAEKTGAAQRSYNDAAALARELVARWNALSARDDRNLGEALAADPGALDRLAGAVADEPPLARRLAHFRHEALHCIPAALAALRAHDLAAFGVACDESQRGAEQLLGNQVPQTSYLARRARELGALASSAFGAGYGGSVWLLAPREEASSLGERLLRDYLARFPEQSGSALALPVSPSGGARAVDGQRPRIPVQ